MKLILMKFKNGDFYLMDVLDLYTIAKQDNHNSAMELLKL